MLTIVMTLLVVQGLAAFIVIGACRAAAGADRHDSAYPSLGHSPRLEQQPQAMRGYAPVRTHGVPLAEIG